MLCKFGRGKMQQITQEKKTGHLKCGRPAL